MKRLKLALGRAISLAELLRKRIVNHKLGSALDICLSSEIIGLFEFSLRTEDSVELMKEKKLKCFTELVCNKTRNYWFH